MAMNQCYHARWEQGTDERHPYFTYQTGTRTLHTSPPIHTFLVWRSSRERASPPVITHTEVLLHTWLPRSQRSAMPCKGTSATKMRPRGTGERTIPCDSLACVHLKNGFSSPVSPSSLKGSGWTCGPSP